MEDDAYPSWLWNLIGEGRAKNKASLGAHDEGRGIQWGAKQEKRLVRKTYVSLFLLRCVARAGDYAGICWAGRRAPSALVRPGVLDYRSWLGRPASAESRGQTACLSSRRLCSEHSADDLTIHHLHAARQEP
jgi:hypothetical protein